MARYNSDRINLNYKLIMDLHMTMQSISTSLAAISNEIDTFNHNMTDMRILINKCQFESKANRENNLYAVLKDVIKALLILIVLLAGGAKVSGLW